jgi:hypothetical protein
VLDSHQVITYEPFLVLSISLFTPFEGFEMKVIVGKFMTSIFV